MRKLSPAGRRAATLCAVCAAIVPSTSLLMFSTHSSPAHFAGGLVVGLAFTICMGAAVRMRRSCS